MAKSIKVWDGSQWVDVAVAMPDVSALAPTNSPSFTGTPTAPTPAPGNDSTQIATTEFVADALAAFGGEEVFYSATAPASPVAGDLWVESDVDISTSTYHAAYSPDAPSGNFEGDLWIESDVDLEIYPKTIITRWSQTVSSPTTVFSGISNSQSLIYTPGYEYVYLNGVFLNRDSDYTATDGSTVTLLVAAEAGDILEVIGFTATQIVNTYTQAQIDTSLASKAPIASPTFTGIPAAPTATVDTNTTQLATTAFVIGQGYLKSTTASATFAPIASPTFTGIPIAPTANIDTNTTQIATTAYVIGQGYLKSSTASSTYAPIVNPTFSGLVTSYVSTNAPAVTTAYTLVLSDASKLVEINTASANTVTIPTNDQVPFPIGTKIDIVQVGAGETSIAPFDGTVTLNSDTNKRKINAQWAAVSLIKRGTNTWMLIGALKA